MDRHIQREQLNRDAAELRDVEAKLAGIATFEQVRASTSRKLVRTLRREALARAVTRRRSSAVFLMAFLLVMGGALGGMVAVGSVVLVAVAVLGVIGLAHLVRLSSTIAKMRLHRIVENGYRGQLQDRISPDVLEWLLELHEPAVDAVRLAERRRSLRSELGLPPESEPTSP